MKRTTEPKKHNKFSLGKILKFLFSRLVITIILIIIQAIFLILILVSLSEYSRNISVFFIITSMLIAVYIVVKKGNPMYKIAWIIPVLLLPIIGGVLYLFLGERKVAKNLKKNINFLKDEISSVVPSNTHLIQKLTEEAPAYVRHVQYLLTSSALPIWENTYSEFLTPGERKLEVLLEELKKAKKFIFMEYFIIQEGEMWGQILDVLIQKVKDGVDVRLMYDDMGCINTLPYNYHKKLISYGIKTRVFNPLKPSMDMLMNNRDHRKIVVIDGNVGITGGINLADEYINAYQKHGYWKDASILLKGEAVYNLTIIFLRLWETFEEKSINKTNLDLYKPTIKEESDGLVMPFDDSPLDEELCGEMAYLNIINTAKKYVYIETPYFIVDNEMLTSLKLAANSGIDVRIITPGIADKWFVHQVTKTYYNELIECGVKIYEFTPGFIHTKTIFSDDEIGIIGTTNFDYRSFYLHFECGCLLYKTKSILDIKKDFFNILKQCEEKQFKKPTFFKAIIRSFLKVFAPLM